MTKREKLLMAAVAGIAMGLNVPAESGAAAKDEVKCWGINSCGSDSKCSVSMEDLKAMKTLLGDKEYQKKFGKSETHGCGSSAKCGGAEGILNWLPTTSAECKAKGGYVIEEVDGKKVAKKA
jgi:hypothetical protein